jgi:GNAT superfamily N-acetyltransferase
MTELAIVDWTRPEADRFAQLEWPAYDAPLGIVWNVDHIVLVARRDEPIGVADGFAVGGVGELKRIIVKKGADRRGIGSSLLAEFERRCVQMGCHKLRLETGDHQARPFYERHGFQCVATLSNDRFGRDWFVMEKRLGTFGAKGAAR